MRRGNIIYKNNINYQSEKKKQESLKKNTPYKNKKKQKKQNLSLIITFESTCPKTRKLPKKL